MPEFIMALESIGEVRNELRPKSPEEIVVEMGKAMNEFYKRNKELKKRAEGSAETDGYLGGL